jgi:hypothetical protein
LGSGVSEGVAGTVGGGEIDVVGAKGAVGVPDGVGVPVVVVAVAEPEAVGDTSMTRSAAEARPTPLPALLTTKKVIAPTAPTTANQPSTITSSGRRPILTTFGLHLL